LKKRLPASGQAGSVVKLLEELDLSTVCTSAHCPNTAECFAKRTATFMILGETCTRHCRFCAVNSGPMNPPRADEPEAVAQAAERLGLRHVVVTSVTRDDLPDGGAEHFARTIKAIRSQVSEAVVEVLIPDFKGDETAIATVCDAGPDVLNHNIETVERLYSEVRPEADYHRSLDLLAFARKYTTDRNIDCCTKSGLMVGLGESRDEITQVLSDLRSSGCDIVTIGQYLAPSSQHLDVVRFMPPEEFDQLRIEAEAMGFLAVAAGPFVRSSYNAEAVFKRKTPGDDL